MLFVSLASYCNARFLARCMFSYLLLLRSGLPSDLSSLRSSLLPNLSAIAFKLAYRDLHERRGEAVRCATAFCIARFLARSLHSDLLLLHSDYAFAQGMCHTYLKGEFLGRAAPRQDNGGTG